MQGAKGLLASIHGAVQRFRGLPPKSVIKVVSHLDADGICAASIAVKALMRQKLRHSVAILPQLDEGAIRQLSKEGYPVFFFTDLGSSHVRLISEALFDRTVFVLDHHRPGPEPGGKRKHPGLVQVNPHLHGIDGSREVSGSGIVYLFMKELLPKNKDLAYLAVIGAIGDSQERVGFRGINEKILSDAVESGRLAVRESLRIFGSETKPLLRLLEQCYSPYIPGVTGSRQGAADMLKGLGINPRVGNSFKRLAHLTPEEVRRLAEGIRKRSLDHGKGDALLGPVYMLKGEPDAPFRDAREFSTLLNACGRMGKAAVGIGACLGDEALKSRSVRVLQDYRKEIVGALDWYESARARGAHVGGDGYIILNARDRVSSTLIGTLSSIISKSDMVPDGTVVLALARSSGGMTKASLRVSGRSVRPGLDLREIVSEIVSSAGKGESGGHRNAAGAYFPSRDEKAFIDASVRVLEKAMMEESVS